MKTESALEVQNLHKYYGLHHAVQGLNLSIPRGSICALLGPNGAGKTSTLEILEGLRAPDGGSIDYFGTKRNAASATIRARIGVQLQTSAFYPHLSVEVLLRTFAALYPQTQSLQKLMEDFGLVEIRKSPMQTLSGGQAQRVALACALINNPDLVFLDEPTTGLDPQAKNALWQSIEKLPREGKTVILTTHDMHEAELLATNIVIMDGGKKIAEGSAGKLKEQYQASNLEEVFLILTGYSLRN